MPHDVARSHRDNIQCPTIVLSLDQVLWLQLHPLNRQSTLLTQHSSIFNLGAMSKCVELESSGVDGSRSRKDSWMRIDRTLRRCRAA